MHFAFWSKMQYIFFIILSFEILLSFIFFVIFLYLSLSCSEGMVSFWFCFLNFDFQNLNSALYFKNNATWRWEFSDNLI